MAQHISDLRGMMKERFIAWFRNASEKRSKILPALPQHVLFYRDGVSESQYGMVLFHEKQQIIDGAQDALQWLRHMGRVDANTHIGWTPKLTLVVATKRHHARFFQTKDVKPPCQNINDPQKLYDRNLGAGMVADSVVVTPNHQSFYLQSHHSPLATARNCLYVVLHDDNKFPPLELQKMVSIHLSPPAVWY
jgi:eukaryotic translation initiation factor 2C